MNFRNNIMTDAFSSAGIDVALGRKIISNPEEYFAGVSTQEAEWLKGIILPAYRKGFRTIFLVGSALAAVAFFVALFLMPQVELTRPDDAKLKAEAKLEADKKKEKC